MVLIGGSLKCQLKRDSRVNITLNLKTQKQKKRLFCPIQPFKVIDIEKQKKNHDSSRKFIDKRLKELIARYETLSQETINEKIKEVFNRKNQFNYSLTKNQRIMVNQIFEIFQENKIITNFNLNELLNS